MDIEVLGIDLSKTVCSFAGLDARGRVVFRKRFQRHRLMGFLESLRPCVVAMEACGGAHHAHFAASGRRFHAISGTCFTPSWAAISRSWASLADACMESVPTGLVKGFRDGPALPQAFA